MGYLAADRTPRPDNPPPDPRGIPGARTVLWPLRGPSADSAAGSLRLPGDALNGDLGGRFQSPMLGPRGKDSGDLWMPSDLALRCLNVQTAARQSGPDSPDPSGPRTRDPRTRAATKRRSGLESHLGFRGS